MAFVQAVERDERPVVALHATQLVCKFAVGERDGKRILQLNTYGSVTRDVPGKLSQTLQFDEAGARQLFDILRDEFGF